LKFAYWIKQFLFKNAYWIKQKRIAADGIEYAFGNKIPLWLFGFLY